MKWLLITLGPMLALALKGYGATKLQSLFLIAVDKATPWFLRNWKVVSMVVISTVAGFLIGWSTKSPEILTQIKIEKIPQYIERVTTLEVVRPHNCVDPVPANREDIRTGSGLVLYLRTEYEFKYKACLDSLDP